MKSYPTVETCLKDFHAIHNGGRVIKYLVCHHTWSPDHAAWRGDKTADGILSYWLEQTKTNGWAHPLGGHFLVSPEGKIYLPFGDLSQPLNADSNLTVNQHGIAVEVVGDFDKGHDTLSGSQRHAVIGLFTGMMAHFGLTTEQVFFHRDFTNEKTCPGSGLDRKEFRQSVANAEEWARSLLG